MLGVKPEEKIWPCWSRDNAVSRKRKHGKSGNKQDSSMTEPDKTRQESGLSQAQYNAIDAILAGATDQETASRCGVSRQTVKERANGEIKK